MNLLAIETSGPVLSVAVKKGKNKIREASFKGYSRHVENLLPLIGQLLRKEKLKIRDIGIFLISRGPGSFTGLRVGFATLKGFLSVRARPCFGALSFDLVASSLPPTRKPGPRTGFSEGKNLVLKDYKNLAVCLNAKRDKLYACSYRYHHKGWKILGAPKAVSPGDWLKQLAKGTLIAGDGLDICGNMLSPEVIPLPKKLWVPRAAALISLYERKDPLLKKLNRPKDLLPVYLRASEAEERLKQPRYKKQKPNKLQ